MGNKAGFWGRTAYRLMLLGVICLLNGLIIGPFAMSTGRQVQVFWRDNQFGMIFADFGAFVYVVGAGLLLISALAAKLRMRRINTLLVIILPGLLPWFFWLFINIFDGLPDFLKQDGYLILTVCLGLVWWGLSYWLVTHFDARHLPPEISPQAG